MEKINISTNLHLTQNHKGAQSQPYQYRSPKNAQKYTEPGFLRHDPIYNNPIFNKTLSGDRFQRILIFCE